MKLSLPALCVLLGVALLGPPQAALAATAAAATLKRDLGTQEYKKLQARLTQLNEDILTRGIKTQPKTGVKMLTGYNYGEYYDWDLYFENVYLSYYGVSDYCFTNLKAFLDQQQPDGFVSRSLRADGTPDRNTQMFKPFLAQIAVLGSRQTGDFTWLRSNYYGRLKKYLDRWFRYDSDGNGLPVWDSADASGMDNQVSRAGGLGAYTDEGVDLACYLLREEQAMAIIADKLGEKEDARAFRAHAAALSKQINAIFWDEKDGFYYDRNEKTGQRVHVKSVTGFVPLWAGVASSKQAARLIHQHLLNPQEFWLPYPVAGYAKSEPDYYQGSVSGECNWRGSAWIPLNYMIAHGLMRYGYKDIARQLAVKTFGMALDKNPVTREYYNAETGAGIGMDPFYGWSSLSYVLSLDYDLNYDPTDLSNPNIRPLLGISLTAPLYPKQN